MNPEIRIVQTDDGSSTLFSSRTGDHYHSLHGAESESEQVFINAGLKEVVKSTSTIRILEVGMGTGLNALLTFQESNRFNLTVEYTTLEPFPLELELVKQLEYSALKIGDNARFFNLLHDSAWSDKHDANDRFSFRKVSETLQLFQPLSIFDLVYYDAFGPRYQPEMWTEEIFKHLFKLMGHGGILVTYCAQGAFRRNLKAAGFVMESLPGPRGKREMTRAIRS